MVVYQRPITIPAKPEIKAKHVEAPWTIEQLTKFFKSYDSNNDGQLSFEEVQAAFYYLGSRWSYFRTAKALDFADANKNGSIDLANFELTELVEYADSCCYKIN